MPQRFQYVDIHAHVNFAAFDADRDEVLWRAHDAGVAVINVGTQTDTSKKAFAMAEQYPEGVYAIVGIHPIHTAKSFHDVKELGEGNREFTSRGEIFDREYYRKLTAHPKVVGVGECGLDYYRIENDELRITQEKVFREQIELAIEASKPLMLHLRNGSGGSAYQDAFSILNSYFTIHNSSLRGNLHFFAGSIEEAKPFLELGFTFSFTGVITFARDYDEVLRFLPLDRILSETDSPYVTPEPHRGKRNEPLYVREVVKAIARIRGEEEEKVRKQILTNAEKHFTVKLS